MCGVWRGAIQRQRVDGMHGVWAWVCDECCGGDGRYHYMHGMCGRTIQQRVDGGVRRVSGGINDGRALGDRGDDVRGVCGWSVQQHVDDGVCAVCGGSVPGTQQPDIVHGLWCWVDDGHVGWSGCNGMLGVWRWAVQQHIDGGVCELSSWIIWRYGGSRGVFALSRRHVFQAWFSPVYYVSCAQRHTPCCGRA